MHSGRVVCYSLPSALLLLASRGGHLLNLLRELVQEARAEEPGIWGMGLVEIGFVRLGPSAWEVRLYFGVT